LRRRKIATNNAPVEFKVLATVNGLYASVVSDSGYNQEAKRDFVPMRPRNCSGLCPH
jgi:hypothetical protein